MPERKQEQYEDALGSIFDFIFTESQKPPGKSKPLKVTGIDGTSEIVDALAAAVENPAMFVNENTINAFQDFVDIDLAKIDLDQRGSQVRLRLKNIGQILKDPGKYIDSQFATAEAIRKSHRMASTGEAMRGIVAGSWAAKKGLDFETRRAMAGVGRADEFSHEMMTRADELMGDHFASGSPSIKKHQLTRKYGPEKGEKLFQLYQKAEKAYHTGSDKDKADVFSGKAGDISGLYSFLEAENIREKARFETDPQKKQDYISASRFVENMSAVREVRMFMEESKRRMKYHQDQIKDLKRRGAPQSVIDQHRKGIKELRSDYNMAQQYEFASKMGTFEGNWYTAKDLLVDGNLLPNIINGNFFNGNLNRIEWLQPATKKKLTFGSAFKDGTWKKGDKKWELEFLAPKERTGPGSKFLNAYTEAMTPLYYLSPVTWVKSLGNGEVFAYRAHLIQKTFEKKILGEVKGALAGFDMEQFMAGIVEGKGMDYINSLSGTVNADLMKKLEKFIKKEGRMTKMAYRFSAVSRMKRKIQDYIEEKVGQKMRDAIGNKLLEMSFIQKFGKEAVDAWMLKGGFRALIKGVVNAALQAIGFSIAGPIGNAIVTALTWIATDVVMKVAKPVIKVSVKVLVFYIGGCFTLFLVVFGGFFLMVFGKHSHVAPNEIVQCEAYRDLNLDQPVEGAEGNCPNCLTNIRINNTSYIPSKASVTGMLDRWVQACPLGGYPEVCYEDVYCRSLKNGIDPAFAFTIWSNESGGSNYANIQNVQDFGINVTAIEADFDSQIDHFLQRVAIPSYSSGCSWQSIDTQGLDPALIKWGTKFLTGACAESSAAQLERGRDYMLQISKIYNWYTNKTLSWPFTVAADSGACDYSSAQVNNVYNSCNQKAQGYCGSGGGDIDIEPIPGESLESLFNRIASAMGLSGARLILFPPGHEMYERFGEGWWCWAYNSNQVYCKSDKVTSSNNTTAKLFKHELTHLRQYRNASDSYGILFMEWGAEWVSGNGGGYSFRTKDGGCIKATETRMLSGCSSEAYQGIAYNEGSYLTTQCFGSLRNYITGFCEVP
ncbi:MAG TPA: hypothetical protein P5311_00600 [Candidatus Dojkabacteria bacterium]|nr:hypothetical protein [Candidatus Dojkabacteria bacterium]